MRVSTTILNQNYSDWDRFEAEERGELVAARPTRPDYEVLRQDIELAQIADSSGFDAVWTIEHHFTPYTMTTNPLQYLTYVAGMTKNVDVGTMVTVLPWHNPIRVAEDVVMLDALIGEGRNVICGVGRGLGRREYGGLGVDQNEARGRFNEGIVVLKRLLQTGECTFDGQYYKLNGVRLRPQPDRDLSKNIYCAGGTQDTFEIICENGVLPLTVPTTSLAVSLKNLKAYAHSNRKLGREPVCTKLNVWTYVSEDPVEAQADAERYLLEYADSALRHYELLGTHLGTLKGYESYAKQAAELRANPELWTRAFYSGHPWGTPEQVLARSTELAHEFGADEIIFVFKYGGMPHEKALKSMKLFADKVLPGLKKVVADPITPWLDEESTKDAVVA